MATGKQLQKKCVRLTWWFCLFFRVLKGYNRYIGQNARRLSDDLAKCTLKMPKWNAQERNDEKEIELLTMRLSKREREQNVWKQKTIKWSRHVMSLHWMDEFCSRFFILIHTHTMYFLSVSLLLLVQCGLGFFGVVDSPVHILSVPRFHNKQLTPSKLMTAGVRRLIEFLLLRLYDKWFASCNQ